MASELSGTASSMGDGHARAITGNTRVYGLGTDGDAIRTGRGTDP